MISSLASDSQGKEKCPSIGVFALLDSQRQMAVTSLGLEFENSHEYFSVPGSLDLFFVHLKSDIGETML